MDENREVSEQPVEGEEPEGGVDVDALRDEFLTRDALTGVEESIATIEKAYEGLCERLDQFATDLAKDRKQAQQAQEEAVQEERELLLDRLVKERVRAIGQGFDEEAYRKRWRERPIEEVKEELKVLEQAAARSLEPGRPTQEAKPTFKFDSDVPLDAVRAG